MRFKAEIIEDGLVDYRGVKGRREIEEGEKEKRVWGKENDAFYKEAVSRLRDEGCRGKIDKRRGK